MELNGLIKRVENEQDKRIVNIFITEKGKEEHEKIKQLFDETDREFLSCLNEVELEETKKVLLKMIDYIGIKQNCQNDKGEQI